MEKIQDIDETMVKNILDRLDLFSRFTEKEKKRILDFRTQYVVYRKGESIIREGSVDTAFYILLKGSVNIIKGKRTFPIAKLEAGDFFGEISFLTNTPRTTTVIANELVIVLSVSKKMLNSLNAEIREKIKDKIIDKLVHRIGNMNEAIVSISYE